MAGKQDNKLDIIRLKRDGKEKSAAPVRRRPQLRKLVISLLPGINEHLRSVTRYRGDFSSMIIEAINSVDLETVRLVDLSTDTRMSTTTVALSPQLHARIKNLARARGASMNEIVNTAIAHWLAAKKLIRLL